MKMKKIMMAVAIVCAAVSAQALTVNWGSCGIQTTGSFDDGDGDFAANCLVYFVNADLYAQSTIQDALANAADKVAAASYLEGIKIATATTDGTGSFMASYDGGSLSALNARLIVLDSGTVEGSAYAFVSDTYAATIDDVTASFDYDGDNWVNALDYSTKAGWTSVAAVPEPTSGLLLLLGVAGLALRRRRA